MTDNTTATNLNRPRNILFANVDPRQPVVLEFSHAVGASLQTHKLIINQSNHDDVWPGGALWDCGILLSLVVLGVAGVSDTITLTATPLEEGKKEDASTSKKDQKKKNKSTTRVVKKTFSQVSNRLVQYCTKDSSNFGGATTLQTLQDILLQRAHLRIVEFGCGVGLTGLVAAVALGASSTILTDLTVVVDQVTRGNVDQNTTAASSTGKKKSCNSNANTPTALSFVEQSRTIRHFKGLGKVLAMPLCWGNQEEGEQVLQALQELHQSALQHPHSTSTSKKKKKQNKNTNQLQPNNDHSENEEHAAPYPDLILLGDVAYQHKPGAPSHFDILLESLLQLMPPIEETATNPKHRQQLLLFGTRIRMPASMDLLELLQSHLSLLMSIPAHCLDPSLQQVKHNMTVHVFTNTKS